MANDITPSTPIAIPAQPASQADKYWAREIIIKAPVIGGDVTATVILVAYNSGTGRPAPVPPKRVILADLFARGQAKAQAGDTSLLQAIGALLTEIDELAKEQGDI